MDELLPQNYHLQIPHERFDQAPVSQAEKVIDHFEKRIVALHNLMLAKQQMPSLDPIRRAAEEVDGIFAQKQFPDTVPELLYERLPAYGERRVLAVETVLCELGSLTRTELDQALRDEAQIPVAVEPKAITDPYQPQIDDQTFQTAKFKVGDRVQVTSQAKSGHIRTPVYLLGKRGVIANVQGYFLNPEDIAHYKSTVLKLPLYLVEFELQEVWAKTDSSQPIQSNPKDKICVEIYEHWLIDL